MPVQEQTPYIKYVANGATQTFSTEFDCESKDQLVVMLNGEEPAFTSWSYADKQVTFVTAPVVDTVVELKRQSKLNRTTDYQSFNHTLNYKALNSDFDRIWYAIQDQNYKVGQYDYDYNFVLTQVRPINTGGTGANNVFNARSNLDVYSKSEVDSLVATGGEGNVVGIANGGTGGTTAAEARTNLGVYSKAETDSIAAIPQSTETALGVAKIATTAIAQAGVNDTDFLTPKKLRDVLNDQAFGVGQTWQNVTSMRVLGTTYTNTTDKLIILFISYVDTTAGTTEFIVDGAVLFSTARDQSGTVPLTHTIPVPAGKTYNIKISGAVDIRWMEYR